jgi:hypothetical protein
MGLTTTPFQRSLRWYPESWRARYGDELTALLEDTYGPDGPVPRRARISLVRSGLSERLRAAGVVGSLPSQDEGRRAGAVLVLCGWAMFVVAGAIFGKFTDNWSRGTPPAGRWLATGGYGAVLLVGILGCVLVSVAAVVTTPAFVRFVRRGGWPAVRRPVRRAAVAALGAGVLLTGGIAWAHQLSPRDRSGGLVVYSIVFVTVCVVTVVALGCATAAAVAVGRRIEVSSGTVRTLAGCALALGGLMVWGGAGFGIWWGSEAFRGASALRLGIGDGLPYTSGVVPPTLVAAGALMVIGLVLGALGARQIARAQNLVT